MNTSIPSPAHLARGGPRPSRGARPARRTPALHTPLRRLGLAAVTALLASCGGLPTSAPIAYQAINLDGRCAQREDDGFREDATLKVVDNQVQNLQWQLWVGRKGSCRFNGTEFRQTKTRPQVELLARDGSGCKLMVWREPRRVTLAHAGCESRCTSSNVYESAWPVMFDPKGGGCADVR